MPRGDYRFCSGSRRFGSGSPKPSGSRKGQNCCMVGSTYGEFSLEKLAAATPGLLIDLSFDDKTLWYVDAKVEQQVTALCPTLGVKMLDLNLVEVIESFTDLAVQLGADPAAVARRLHELDPSG